MPTTRSRHEASKPAIIPQSPSNNRDPRPSIKTLDLGVGCIVWLPSKGNDEGQIIKCIREFCCSNRELHESGYNHPVVVLKVSTTFKDAFCSVAQVTSKKRTDRLRISQEIPAQRPYDGNDRGTELYLESGTMHKQSYVVLEHIFLVPALQLRSCSFRSGSRAYDHRLCGQSYTLLMASLGLEPADWVTTIDLKPGVTSSRETPRRSARKSRTFVNCDDATTRHPTQQSLRAADINSVLPSPRRYTEQSPLLANNTSSRMPGIWHPQSSGRGSYYDTYGGSRRPEQSGHVPPTGYSNKFYKVIFTSLVVLFTVGSFVWWFWQIK